MTDSVPDLPPPQTLPRAIEIGPQAQYAAIGLIVSGAAGALISALSLTINTVVSVLTVVTQLVQLGHHAGSMAAYFVGLAFVSLCFGLSFILPLATSLGAIYAGFSLHHGGSARRIRVAAIASLVGYAFLILGAFPGLILGGCTSMLVLLSSPLLTILSVGAAVLAFVAVREGELIQQDEASPLLETP